MSDREKDKKYIIYPEKSRKGVSLDVIKSKYIANGLTAQEIADDCYLPVEKVEAIIEENSLAELRKAYIVQGIENIQNIQIDQSKKLLDIANNFKKLRIIQLEAMLEDFVAYYQRHGHFYKLHPVSGDTLKDNNGIPMQLKLPNVTKELQDLKESVTMSQGVKELLNRLDDIINSGKPVEAVNDPDVIDVSHYQELFKAGE